MTFLFDADHWREIGQVLRANKLRTALTGLGVFWGIFMLMAMLGSGKGLSNGVAEGFSDGATNSLFVWSQRTSKPYRGMPIGREIELTLADGEAIRREIPEAGIICPRNQLGGYRGGNNVTRGTKAGAFSVMGDYPEIATIQSVRLTSGRFLNHLDIEERRKVTVIGSRVREVLFGPVEDPLGQLVRVNGVYFKVIGTFQPRRSHGGHDDQAQSLFIPFTTFRAAFNEGEEVGWFALTSRDGIPASKVEEKVLAFLKERHRVAPEDTRAFGHFNIEEEYNQVQGVFGAIGAITWLVGIGTLAAGVIGVSNIMLVIVRERTNEIGIRRAVGATPFAVIAQIVMEALVLTSVAGLLGLSAGVGVIELAGRVLVDPNAEMFRNPEVTLQSALLAVAILVLSGVAAGFFPARRAVAMHPVEALRAV